MIDFIFVCDGDVHTIKDRGRVAQGYPRYYNEVPEQVSIMTHIGRPNTEPQKFKTWGIEKYSIGGASMITGICIPDTLDIEKGDLIILEVSE